MKIPLILLAATFPALAEMPPVQPVKVSPATVEIPAGTQILDVRSKMEWDRGHLASSRQVSLGDEYFTEKVKAVIDRSKPVLVYCRSGRCSARAVKQLRAAGFAKVEELAGGIDAWSGAGRPLEMQAGATH